MGQEGREQVLEEVRLAGAGPTEDQVGLEQLVVANRGSLSRAREFVFDLEASGTKRVERSRNGAQVVRLAERQGPSIEGGDGRRHGRCNGLRGCCFLHRHGGIDRDCRSRRDVGHDVPAVRGGEVLTGICCVEVDGLEERTVGRIEPVAEVKRHLLDVGLCGTPVVHHRPAAQGRGHRALDREVLDPQLAAELVELLLHRRTGARG